MNNTKLDNFFINLFTTLLLSIFPVSCIAIIECSDTIGIIILAAYFVIMMTYFTILDKKEEAAKNEKWKMITCSFSVKELIIECKHFYNF